MNRHRLLGQHFGDEINFDDILSQFDAEFERNSAAARARDAFHKASAAATTRGGGGAGGGGGGGGNDGGRIVGDKFQVCLDVQQFAPEEITIKAIDGNTITVDAKHEERRDEQGFIERHFSRRYIVPDTHDIDRVVSNLSSDGILTITAPRRS